MRSLRIFLLLIATVACSSLIGLEAIATHRQGSGVGYKRQYSKIGIYHAFENQRFQPFIDLRYLVLNTGKQGANLGAGLGYQFAQENRLSAYAYFDLTESRTQHIFNQITAGLSYTQPLVFSGKDWGEIACYFNGYFPLKSHENKVKGPSFGGFRGYHLLICQTDRYALTGSNFEVGYLSNSWNNWNLYVAGSTYYFKRSELHCFGGLGKLRLTYNDLISIEGQVSGDRLFGTNVTGTIGIRIPLGKREMKAVKNRRYCPHKSRPPERFEPIVLDKNKRKFVAKDPSGAPLNFIFVNNLNGSDGTFEDPFATLADAQNASHPGNVIYVFPGDGTTKGMDQGFMMQDRQTLAGSGVALDVNTNKGLITIPAMTLNGPQMTNPSGNGVDINKNCTVSGITVNGSSGAGFAHTLTEGLSNINVLHCTANNVGTIAFEVDLSGSSQLSAFFNHCTAFSSTSHNFGFVSENSSTLTATFNNCASVEAGNDGFEHRPRDSSNSSLIFNNWVSRESNSDGFDIRSFDFSRVRLTFNNCRMELEDGEGYEIAAAGTSNISVIFNNCQSINTGGDGFEVTSSSAAQFSAIFNNCQAIQGGNVGIEIRTSGTSNSSVIFNNCHTSDAQSNSGFRILTSSVSNLQATFNNCTGNNNDDHGISCFAANDSNLTLSMENCSFTNSIDDGFNIVSAHSSILNAQLINCSSNNTMNQEGFSIQSNATSTLDAQLKDCMSNNSATDGYHIQNLGTSLTGSLENCSASGNGSSSFDIDTPVAGTFTIAGDATLDLQL